ncbi:unnamed protein product [Bemisia tabaci]|uniref:Uncharacterized protein n=1 Tax=Bemisia tabaci TaxID=7038 RepID=A0A9P0A5I3_BEMTA|nr:unnamed protein product [Bemisia tabaci]
MSVRPPGPVRASVNPLFFAIFITFAGHRYLNVTRDQENINIINNNKTTNSRSRNRKRKRNSRNTDGARSGTDIHEPPRVHPESVRTF